MFAPYLLPAWGAGLIVAVMAGVVGFFVVSRGESFAAHTLPLAAFPGAAAAALFGLDPLTCTLASALAAAAVLAAADARARHVATAMTLTVLLATGALFLSLTGAYGPSVTGLLFGAPLGAADGELAPLTAVAAAAVFATLFMFRPLLLDTLAPELLPAGGRGRRAPLVFLLVLAAASAAALPVVGATLVFALTVGPPAAARAWARSPLGAMGLSVALAVATVAASFALSFATDWPVGFFVGALGLAAYGAGRVATAGR